MRKIYAFKTMGKAGLIVFATFLGMTSVLQAQTASTVNYSFTTNATASLSLDAYGNTVDMSTGTSQAVGAGLDASQLALTDIGFDFYFMGNRFTQFSVNDDGQLRLGATAGTNNYALSSGTAAAPKLSAFNADLRTGTGTGKVHYKMTGTAPNRVLIVEFKDMQLFYTTASAGSATWQMRLYESTGKIEYVYGDMSVSSISAGNKSPSIGFYSGSATGSFASVTYATHTVSTTSPFSANPAVGATGPIAELNSASDGNRRIYTFTPPAVSEPTSVNFSSVTASSVTVNWSPASPLTGIVNYVVYYSPDGINYFFGGTVPVGTNSLNVTGLTPGTNYSWKVYSVSEGAISIPSTGTQATGASAMYYWVGTGSADFNTGSNWNTAADGSGSARVADNTDVLIIDGDGTTPGAPATITLSANVTVGILKISNNTSVTISSSTTTTRTITIGGGSGDDLDIPAGSSLSFNDAANGAAIVFTGTGNTGNIAGTFTLGGTTSNKLTTTGGTGTVVTVSGTVNLTTTSATAVLVGSTATLNFANGSNCNVSGYTTTNAFIPTATWAATSSVTLSGGTTGTGITSSSTSYGNFNFNSSSLMGTLSAFTTGTITIQGNLNVVSTNTGIFRALTSGTLTILGNLNISGGTFQVASGAGTIKLAGNLAQTGGTLDATGTTNSLEFNGTSSQNATVTTMGTGAVNVRINNAGGVNLTGTLNINNGASLTVSNGNLTGAGTVVYNATSGKLVYNGSTGQQTANATEFPGVNGPVGLTINNTATNPGNVVFIPFTRALGIGGNLALTAGILNNTGFVLSVTNTSSTAVTGGSAGSYVTGTLTRDLPASLATGSNYIFPIGKGGYNPLELVNPTTNAGGNVTVQAEAFDANSNGTAGLGLSAINTNRYWMCAITNGAGNFTNTLLRLYDTPGAADGIGGSATQTGVYAIAGGGSPSVTASTITTVAPELTSLPGYYVMGTRATPALSNLAITPSASQCTNVARTVTVTVTPTVSAIAGVVIDYSINGVAQASIAMSNVGGNDWSGTIPTVTPANATVSWSVTASDVNSITKTVNGTDYQDEPIFGAVATATASPASICSGSSSSLNISLSQRSITIGNGTSFTGTTDDITAFGNRWPTFHMQLLYTAAELSAAGMSAGPVNSITFNISSIGSAANNTNYVVMVGNTALSALTGYEATTGYTTVFPAATYVHAIGLNTLNFSTPFMWNGTSNIILDFSYSGINSSTNAETAYTPTANNTVAAAHSGNSPTLSVNRPNIIFTQPYTVASYSWSDGSTTVGTTNPLSVSPTINTGYTATLSIMGCSLLSNTANITVNQVPTSPSATNSTQCGTGIPTASVASTAGGSGTGTFYWYDAPTGGSLLQGAAYGSTLTNYFVNDFSSAILTDAALSGNASISGGQLILAPNSTSQQGGLSINASGTNPTMFQIDFDAVLTNSGTDMADGFSYSFADDADATTTSPAAEHGSGSKLRISFDTYDAINANNGRGIYVMYNTSELTTYTVSTPGVLGYVPDVSWIPSGTTQTSHVTIAINAAAQLTLTLNGTAVFTNLQLPPAFVNANKANWKHVFVARTGGIAGGFNLDNIAIQTNAIIPGYTTYQNSITGTTTFYVSELGNGGCESTRTPVTVTFTSDPITALANSTATPPAITVCPNSSLGLNATQTGSTQSYTYSWDAIPQAGSGISGPTVGASISATPTAAGSYMYIVSGVDGACTASDTAFVTVNIVPNVVVTPVTGNAQICGGNTLTLTAGAENNLFSENFDATPIGMTVINNSTGTNPAAGAWTQHPDGYQNTGGTTVHTFHSPTNSGFVMANSDAIGSGAAGNTELISQVVSTNGYTGLTLTFNHYFLPLTNTVATIEVSVDGVNWTVVKTYNYSSGTIGADNAFAPASIDLSAYINQPSFQFKFKYTSNWDWFWVMDDVVLKGVVTGLPVAWDASPSAGAGLPVSAATASASNNIISVSPAPGNYTYNATVTTSGGCPAIGSTALTISQNPITALATTGASGSNVQADGTSFQYTDASCNLIAAVTDAPGGTTLGSVTTTLVIDGAVQNVNGQPYLARHYTITPSSNNPATLTLYALQSGFDAYNLVAGAYPQLPTTGSNSDPNIPNIRVSKFSGTPFTAPGTLLTPTSVNWNGTAGWWEINLAVSSFSSFYIHTGTLGPLSIKLLTFNGMNEGSRNHLNWTTGEESTGDYFIVQRSIDGINFNDLGMVNADGKNTYSYYDEKPAAGINHYRLKLMSAKGAESYSKTIRLMVNGKGNFTIEAYPNPVKDIATVKVYGQVSDHAQLQLTDVAGKLIRKISVNGDETTMDMHDVAPGIYMLKYIDDSHSQTFKMNKQ